VQKLDETRDEGISFIIERRPEVLSEGGSSMPASVGIRVVKGKHAGKEYVFTDRDTCIIGRAADCRPSLPDDAQHRTISRHHCLLEINPPDIRVRDFGSLNGTFVNGAKIGQRQSGQTPEEGQKMVFPERDLKNGDEIQLGSTIFRVNIFVPLFCENCWREIPSRLHKQTEAAPGIHLCNQCRKKAEQPGQGARTVRLRRVCARCGRDVSDEIGLKRPGDYVCNLCRKDPPAIIERLLQQAESGEKDLTSIQRYCVIKELGRGGMGAVYLARQGENGPHVALKVMLPRVAADESAKAYFLREAENTRALKHRNIVGLHDYGCCDGIFFFTLEFCDGGSVAKLMLKRSGTLPIEEATNIILQVLDGLEYAHKTDIPYVKLADGRISRGRGLVHRDIKPQNILLSNTNGSRVAKISDFGLAKAFDMAGLSGWTRTGIAAGTPFFMARQQVVNFKYSKPDVDVWAVAASLYNMLTGAFPRDFPGGKDPWQVVLQNNPVPIRRRNALIPGKLARVIDEALVDRPSIRIKTAAELKRALKGAF